jgi:hypothetical protein
MLRWLSSSTLFVALTLIDSIIPKSYLCKLTVTVHGPLWQDARVRKTVDNGIIALGKKMIDETP